MQWTRELTSSLGVHHSLWDPLPVKVGHLVKVHKVLEQDWTPWSSCHGVQLVIHWMTMAGCHDIRSLGVGAHQYVCVCGGGGGMSDSVSVRSAK